jgi:hypothetical protein
LWGNRREGEAVIVVREGVPMAVAERLNTEAAEIKGAIEKIAPDDVAFVQEHLAAKITSNTGAGSDGNQRN